MTGRPMVGKVMLSCSNSASGVIDEVGIGLLRVMMKISSGLAVSIPSSRTRDFHKPTQYHADIKKIENRIPKNGSTSCIVLTVHPDFFVRGDTIISQNSNRFFPK